MRLAWLSLPLTAGTVVADALDGRSGSVQLVASTLSWAGWAGGVLAVLLPRPVGCTAIRLATPAAFGTAVWAAVDVGGGAAAALAVLSGAPLLLAFLPEIGSWFVNGAAYGDERRYLLRAPGALLLGPIPLAGVVLLAGAVTGPLLLAAGVWGAGAVALVVGVPAAVVCARALHQLSNRWAVLVPAGLVLKDHVVVLDPVLFRRQAIEVLRPAPAGTDALDLTARSPGLALELRLKEPENLVLTVPGSKEPRYGKSSRLLFSPTRPGALLADAGARRIPTG